MPTKVQMNPMTEEVGLGLRHALAILLHSCKQASCV